ncbi:FAD-dependent oxidoreductase [Myxococcota bacterium]|nr:FAD-dependent oxidoreductase [Myxococcota bacterium]
MSDRFSPLSMAQTTAWIFDELERQGSVFGIPADLFYRPSAAAPYRAAVFDQPLSTPFGVAAGPHSQLTRNIVAAWLCGARFIELKTVQTLDELEISKPCIDMEDEGYNVEWSQELKVEQSLEQYARAWVLIHALHHKLGFEGERPEVIFNLSVGYNLEGIKRDNVQWFLAQARDISARLPALIEAVAARYPQARQLTIPAEMSNSVTLSTMHGCPPDEIERISEYLIAEKGFHTYVKLNPTLLGPELARRTLNEELGFEDIIIPDEAFGHDLKYADAVPMLQRLKQLAKHKKLAFGVKLSNTLEVENHRDAFSPNERHMYMSGRPLHALTIRLAAQLNADFHGELPMSYAGGADAFNVAALLKMGMQTITVCSDLLKSGGYTRMTQYMRNTRAAFAELGATSTAAFIVKSALAAHREAFVAALSEKIDIDEGPCEALLARLEGHEDQLDAIVTAWAEEEGLFHVGARRQQVIEVCAGLNLAHYAAHVTATPRLHKRPQPPTKTQRPLGLFDCIEAPCTDTCPVNQDVPAYMRAVAEGRVADAVAIVRGDNPIPAILSRICDRKCQDTCVRTHFDEPLNIREIKRYIMDHEATPPAPQPGAPVEGQRVAIIGGGPCGVAAALALGQAGYPCTIFEQLDKLGGMVSGTIPSYRLPDAVIAQDTAQLDALGTEIRFHQRAGVDFTLARLYEEGFTQIIVATGAQIGRALGLEGEDAAGILDATAFLRRVRDGLAVEIGPRVAVIGGGDVAMDSARTATRLGATVSVIYRRTRAEMPADPEEIEGLIAEAIPLYELASPKRLIVEGDQLKGLVCDKMELGLKGPDGRRRPVETGEEIRFDLDTLILAVSQRPVLDFFGDLPIELTPKGDIKIDPITGETSLQGVYAGGDTAGAGAASAVKASGDGKRIADRIIGRQTKPHLSAIEDINAALIKRAERVYGVTLPHRLKPQPRDFDEVLLTLSDEAAQAEAARCLDCDSFCSLCVGVCPNRALFTYAFEGVSVAVPTLSPAADGGLVATLGETFEVIQGPQVAVVTDCCNECGDCATFCPTAGRPYRDKPRFYFNEAEFMAEASNAFALAPDLIRGRFDGETHSLRRAATGWVYQAPQLKATFAEGFTFQAAEGQPADLTPAAILYTLFIGVEGTPLPAVAAVA